MLRARVSMLDQLVHFLEPKREEWEVSVEDFIRQLKRESEPNDAMLAGTAFHSVLERAREGDVLDGDIEQDGFTFRFACDVDLHLPAERESETPARIFHTPHGVVSLQGRTDGRDGFTVYDHKLTGRFDAERYAESMQWRSYLLLTGAKRFRYLAYEQSTKPDPRCANCGRGEAEGHADDCTDSVIRPGGTVTIHAVHTLDFWAYPEMEAEVSRRVFELAEFVSKHVPEMFTDNVLEAA